ncbi:aromatic amino acid transport family protein [Vibrio sp. SCSIO 43137]|uniref:aromatic amino acid transport family protein n=1 Tax=Vibrio sp. SCSIO 43137 TaxID=3021011 RepID=UPI002308006A|nr:aromatic amino acid transport family protein [Vibrio sp. SCSIO 43137]WCE32235.1 aromatic amino acid transporter [Vibrio sp. SCSIO 43137]
MTKSKVLGSTLIVAGTTIGAGMLALPLASAGIGFFTSLAIMALLWALMTYTALLMLELHQHAPADATLHTLAKQFLGKKGKWIASFSMMFLFYALCAAYIAGGGSQFGQRIVQLTGIELGSSVATILFTFIVALVVTIGTGTVDRINRLLFATKLIAMVVVLFFLAPNVTESYLLNMPLQQGLIVASIPVIFTSFGFHGSIPAIVNYLEGDTRSLKKAIIIGSAIPLVIYLFWQIVTLGVVSQQELTESQGLSALIASLATKVHFSQLGQIIGLFADLALLTSFLGVSLGLFEFLGDTMKKGTGSNNRVVSAFVTFLPPMCFALFYPQGFIMALGYAAIALAVLAIFLPVAMVRKARQDTSLPLAGEAGYQVRGGQMSLALVTCVGVLIVAAQFMITFGYLPSLG